MAAQKIEMLKLILFIILMKTHSSKFISIIWLPLVRKHYSITLVFYIADIITARNKKISLDNVPQHPRGHKTSIDLVTFWMNIQKEAFISHQWRRMIGFAKYGSGDI